MVTVLRCPAGRPPAHAHGCTASPPTPTPVLKLSTSLSPSSVRIKHPFSGRLPPP